MSIIEEAHKRLLTIQHILRSESLPLSIKWAFLWVKLRRRLPGCPNMLKLPIAQGFVFMDPRHPPDLGTFREIFIEEHYLSNYQDRVVIDIGAHLGYFTAYALTRGACAVFAFEPEERNFLMLEAMAATFLEHGHIVFPHKIAVTFMDGEVDFYITNQSRSHSLYQRPDREILRVDKVPALSLERVVRRAREYAGQKRRILVKIDVEGTERDLILRTPAEVFLEIDEMFVELHYRFATYKATELVECLKDVGFSSISYVNDEIVHCNREK